MAEYGEKPRAAGEGDRTRLIELISPFQSALRKRLVMEFEIIQVVQDFSTEGGAETVAYELAAAWSRAGIKNTVVASSGKDTAGNLHRVQPWLRYIPTRGMFRYAGRTIVFPIFTMAATLALRKYREGVIVSHGDSFGGDVLVVHAVDAASLDQKKRSGNWRWRLNPMHFWVLARDRIMIGGLRYRHFIAVSPRVASELQHYYGVPEARISVIPNGIDLQKFKPDPTEGARIRAEFGISAKARVLLFVGHEFHRKGLSYAIEALNELEDDVCLLVVGSDIPGPYKKLARNAAGRLFFAGQRRDLPAFYAAADLFVLPTAYETFSLVCMEALACGLPVLASRVGGIEDYLKDGYNGYAVERAPADIAAKVRLILSEPSHHAALRKGARLTAEQFSWESVSERYAKLLRDIWEAKSRPRSIRTPVEKRRSSATKSPSDDASSLPSVVAWEP
jgi:UDP-glucose:(heptosyl)LPS alpha-1,3-glucosyltransferase